MMKDVWKCFTFGAKLINCDGTSSTKARNKTEEGIAHSVDNCNAPERSMVQFHDKAAVDALISKTSRRPIPTDI